MTIDEEAGSDFTRVTVRMQKKLKSAIERAARRDDETLSRRIRRLVAADLKAAGIDWELEPDDQ